MKEMIDTQGKISALTQQQKLAEEEVNKAIEQVKVYTNKAVEKAQVTGYDKMVLV